jgi:ureidoacrylate peracid hydrolase
MPTKDVESKLQSRVASLPAKPHTVALDTANCAVIVIDMQNDFGTEGGMFHRAGIDISMIQRAVEPTRRTLVVAREIGIPVIYLKMGFKPDLSDAGPMDSPNFARH